MTDNERRAYKKALDDFMEKMNEQSELTRSGGWSWSAVKEIIDMRKVRTIKEELMKVKRRKNGHL